MKSVSIQSTLRAALLTAILVGVWPAATVADGGTPAVAAASLVQERQTPKAPPAAEVNEAPSGRLADHALSTLGAIVLGIIGLLWVRRHTAER